MTASPTNSSLQSLHPGDKLGKFEIVQQIGMGGTSTVWKGYDRLLDRFVAIKQIVRDPLASKDQEAFLEKLRAEVQLQKRIGSLHKNLVKVYDLIEEPRGLFIVMEFVDGPTLAQFMAKNPLPMDPRQALGLVGAAAMALAAIHKEGVIHRDLKPSNILLPKNGGLKICDYGLATLMADQDSLAVGSVRYMAPELFGTQPVTAKADIYSLGMIAYELMAGKQKFEDAFKIVLRDQRNQSMRWMKWHTNPRASAPPLQQANPAVDQRLGDLVARMMEKDPDQRIGTADELLAAIRRHFSGQPSPEEQAQQADAARVAAMAAAAAAEPTAALPRKSRWPMILTASLAAQIVAAVVLMFLFSQKQANAVMDRRNGALVQFAQARADLHAADERLITPRGLSDQEKSQEVQLYTRAKTRFDHLAKTWAGDSELGKPSAAWALYCQAATAYAEGRFGDAFKLFGDVEKMSGSDKTALVDRDYLQKKKDAANIRDAVATMLKTAAQDIQDNKFDDARAELRKLDVIALTSVEQEQKKKLFNSANGTEVTAIITDTLAAAGDLYAQGKRPEARQLLLDANKRAAAHEYPDQIARWDRSEKIEGLQSQFRDAEVKSDLSGLSAALRQLTPLLPAADLAPLQAKENQLRSDDECRKGDAAFKAGHMEEAQDHYNVSDRLVPNPAAKAGLAKIKNADDWASIVRNGDSALSAGRFAEAIDWYQRAEKLKSDPSVTAKSKDAQIKQLLQQAQVMLQQNKLDEARALFKKVIDLDPANKQAADGIALIDTTKNYLETVKSADGLRSQGKAAYAKAEYQNALDRFGEAGRQLVRARDIIKGSPELWAKYGEEIKQRIDDVEYDRLLTQARLAIDAGDWKSAKGYLQAAGATKVTNDWKALADEVKKHDDAQNNGP